MIMVGSRYMFLCSWCSSDLCFEFCSWFTIEISAAIIWLWNFYYNFLKEWKTYNIYWRSKEKDYKMEWVVCDNKNRLYCKENQKIFS